MNKYLTISKLNTVGRLANQLFLLASAYGMAKKNGRILSVPSWKYKEYFNWGGYVLESPKAWHKSAKEPHFHYAGNYFDSVLQQTDATIDIEGYVQTEKYFEEYKEDVLKILSFRPEFKERLLNTMKEAFSKPTIGIHVRRGDYVDNPNYHNLPPNYYFQALEKYFPNWDVDYNIIIFSDDIHWCKTYLNGNNIHFSEGKTDIEDLCLLSCCNNFILSNSSYSWWGAYISNTIGTIIRPSQLFEGDLKKSHKIKDFWPPSWIEYNYENQKLDLKDVTFTIPIHYDHIDRAQNFTRVISFLRRNFDTNIIVGEQGSQKFKESGNKYTYLPFPELKHFHRTKMLNDMAKLTNTPIIVNYDADVIIPAIQILQAVKMCRKGHPAIFPYDGRFCRIPHLQQKKEFHQLNLNNLLGSRQEDPPSLGGCILFNKEEFIKMGMENENFISYGPEDVERVVRIQKLGHQLVRVRGPLFHYDHFVGKDSSPNNPFFQKNCEELNKIRTLTPDKLREYISTWKWIEKGPI